MKSGTAARTPGGRGVLLGLLALLAVQAALHGAWLSLDQRLPFWDQQRYFRMTWQAASLLQGHEEMTGPGALLDLHASHPPLYSLSAALPLLLHPPGEYWSARWINLLWAALLTLSTFALARRRLGEGSALLAAALAAFTPLAFSFAHMFYIEVLLAPWVVCCVLALERRQEAWRARDGFVVGLLLGVGCLIKWSFPLFLIGPVLVVILRRRRWGPVLMLLLGGLLVAAPWYLAHLDGIIEFFGRGVVGAEGQLSGHTGLAGLAFYPRKLVGSALGIPLAAASIFGLVILWRRQRAFAVTVFALILVAGGVLTVALTKKPRHLLPALPFLALAAAAFVEALPRPMLRRAAGGLLLAHAFVGCLFVGFALPSQPPVLELGPLRLPALVHASPPGPPVGSIWPYREVMSSLEELRGDAEEPTPVLLTFNLSELRWDGFVYLAMVGDEAMAFDLIAKSFPYGNPAYQAFPLEQILAHAYVVTKTGNSWIRFASGVPIHRHGARLTEEMDNPASSLASFFPERRPFDLPDGSRLSLRALKPGPEAARALARFTLRYSPESEAAWRTLGETAVPQGEARRIALVLRGVLPTDVAEALERSDLGRGEGDDALLDALLRQHPDRPDVHQRLRRAWNGTEISPAASALSTIIRLREHYRTGPDGHEAALALARWHSARGEALAQLIWLRRALEADRRRADAVRVLLPPALRADDFDILLRKVREEERRLRAE